MNKEISFRDNTKQNILGATQNGLDVFNYYLPYSLPMQKNFKSPFYEDSKASCNVFQGQDGIWRYKDFGDSQDGGDCFWFVATLKGLDLRKDFPRILDAIITDLHLPIASPVGQRGSYPTRQTMPTRTIMKEKAVPPTPKQPSPTAKFEYVKKEYTDEELAFWEHYGITKAILKRYKVYSLRSFSSFRSSDGAPYTINSSENEPMFLYDLGTAVKIYRPFSQMRFLNAGERAEVLAFGLEQLPMKGDIVFITGGEKDVMSLSVRNFNAISFNSETSLIDTSIIEMLKRRFKHILLCYDMDDTGVKASLQHESALSNYKVLRVELPLSGDKTEKDISDYFTIGHTRNDMQELVSITLEKNLYQQTKVLLSSCEINLNNPPEVSRRLVSLDDMTLGSFGNLLCVTGGEGTGKSNYVSALISGAISLHALPAKETLGMSVAPNTEGMAVLHFDTEQSDAQLYKNVKRSLKRAQINDIPHYYHPFCLTAFSRNERLKLIQESMDMYYHRHDGIHLVVLDGIADLIMSANNESESVAIVEELYRLAGIYNTCIVCVLHLTPGGLKLRGHLGSELQRKAAGIISIDKDKSNPALSVVKALKVRDGDPYDIPMMVYSWDKELEMHVYRCNKSKKESDDRKYEELLGIAKNTLGDSHSMGYNDFVNAISDYLLKEYNLKDRRTSITRIEFMLENGIIEKVDDDTVQLCDNSL